MHLIKHAATYRYLATHSETYRLCLKAWDKRDDSCTFFLMLRNTFLDGKKIFFVQFVTSIVKCISEHRICSVGWLESNPIKFYCFIYFCHRLLWIYWSFCGNQMHFISWSKALEAWLWLTFIRVKSQATSVDSMRLWKWEVNWTPVK